MFVSLKCTVKAVVSCILVKAVAFIAVLNMKHSLYIFRSSGLQNVLMMLSNRA